MEFERINEAYEQGNLEYFRKYKTKLFRRDNEGYYPIHRAIMAKQVGIVEILYNKQKSCRTYRGQTCLMLAICTGCMELIVMFLWQIDIHDKRKHTIWHYLIEQDDPKLMWFMSKHTDHLKDTMNENTYIDYCMKNESMHALEMLVQYYNMNNYPYSKAFLDTINEMVMDTEKQVRKNVIKNYQAIEHNALYNCGTEDCSILYNGHVLKYHTTIGSLPTDVTYKSAKIYKKFLYFGKVSELEFDDSDEYKNNVIEILRATHSRKFACYLMTILAYKKLIDMDIFSELIQSDLLDCVCYKILIKKGIMSMKQRQNYKNEDVLRIVHLVNELGITGSENEQTEIGTEKC